MSARIGAGISERRRLEAILALRSLGKSRARFVSAAYSAPIVDRRSRPDLLFEPHSVLVIGTGVENGYAVTSTGAVWSWGNNNHGELGIDTIDPEGGSDAPAQVTSF